MDVPVYVWIFLPLLGSVIGSVIGARAYKDYNRKRNERGNKK